MYVFYSGLRSSTLIKYIVWWWKYTFGKDTFLAVAETTLTAKAPSYATVLELDRKVRQMPFQAPFKPYVNLDEPDYHSSSSSVRGFYSSQHRTVS